MEIKIVPSGRIDYCSTCKADHGYDCHKDIEEESSPNCGTYCLKNSIYCTPPISSLSSTWEEEEREAFIKWYGRANPELAPHQTKYLIADYWLSRIAHRVKEAGHGDCYCVCHNENSSRAVCEHCEESVKRGRTMYRSKIKADLQKLCNKSFTERGLARALGNYLLTLEQDE